MRRLKPKQRRERMRENYREAMEEAGRDAGEPGLRDAYPAISRAPIRLVVCPLGKAVNHGGLLRLAEAYRLELVDFQVEEDRVQDVSGDTGAHFWQEQRWIDAADSIAEAKGKGHRIYGLALDDEAIPLGDVEWVFPAAIVLGEEKTGIPPDVKELCDAKIAIPLFGMVTSINVGHAAAITVEAAVSAYRRECPEFEPVRNASRRLLGLADASYPQRPEGQDGTKGSSGP